MLSEGVNMFSAEEYKDIKKRDLDFAFEIEDIIHKSPDPDVRYKDSRPIMDLKHMLESSASDKWYGNNMTIYQKFQKKGNFESITYREVLEIVSLDRKSVV